MATAPTHIPAAPPAGQFRLSGEQDCDGRFLRLSIIGFTGVALGRVDIDADRIDDHIRELQSAKAALLAAGDNVVPFGRPASWGG
jgi:hypothetical protein